MQRVVEILHPHRMFFAYFFDILDNFITLPFIIRLIIDTTKFNFIHIKT